MTRSTVSSARARSQRAARSAFGPRSPGRWPAPSGSATICLGRRCPRCDRRPGPNAAPARPSRPAPSRERDARLVGVSLAAGRGDRQLARQLQQTPAGVPGERGGRRLRQQTPCRRRGGSGWSRPAARAPPGNDRRSPRSVRRIPSCRRSRGSVSRCSSFAVCSGSGPDRVMARRSSARSARATSSGPLGIPEQVVVEADRAQQAPHSHGGAGRQIT